MAAAETYPELAALAPRLDELARLLKVRSVLVMRSEPSAMAVAATAGAAAEHYPVGAVGKKAGDDQGRVPLYCERVVDTDEEVFVRDSRVDDLFKGNEDEVEFGLTNYLGLPVHDAAGAVVGTVCVLDDAAREYTDAQRAELAGLRAQVEAIVRSDGSALG
ncbi:histidine kinase [Mycobacteroides saopaulense]|uniref:GAF domain-containing protein n=1 Tax=Mycobacteroides saopaulense TaxID=1578165 RepID=UPI00072275F1|nr:GAF domain-containing protein [Mycobacteroides saopaulense]ALR10225.1 histidine kinase [Mycobacteroides saopaulense]